MKKSSITILIVIIALAFGWGIYISSKGDNPNTPTKSGDQASEITLDFWHIMNYEPVVGVIDEAVARFEKENPGVKVRQNRIKNDVFKNKLSLAFGAGNAPDIFHTWGGGILKTRFDEGLVLPLDDLFKDSEFHDKFLPASLQFAYIDGTPMCVPADIALVLLYYNKDIFKKVGVTIPSTFSELLATCKKLRSAGYTPFALGNSDRWPGCFYYAYATTRAGGKQIVTDASSLNLDSLKSPAFEVAGNVVKKLVDNNCFNKGFQGIKTSDSRRLIFNESAAMTLMGTWLIPYASKENPEMLKKLGCFPFPTIPASEKLPTGDDNSVIGGINCAYAISSSCKHPALAKKLLRALTDAKFAASWAKLGRIPAVVGAKDTDFMPLTRQAFAILEKASFIQMYWDQLFPPQLAEAHKDTVQALFSGILSPKQVVEKMLDTAKTIEKK